jgi:hypothetical protein
MNLQHIPTTRYRDYNLGVRAEFNPFVQVIRKALNSNSFERELLEGLGRYFATFAPEDVYQYVGLSKIEAPGLTLCEAWTAPYPWTPHNPAEDLRIMRKGLRIENARWLAREVAGASWCGPAEALKVEVEARRYISLINSIREHGYVRSEDRDGDIDVIQLVDDERVETCFLLSSGAHRAGVLCALGYVQFPAKVVGYVSRSEADQWFNVRNGCYSAQAARKVFDRVMRGDPVDALRDKLGSLPFMHSNVDPRG